MMDIILHFKELIIGLERFPAPCLFRLKIILIFMLPGIEMTLKQLAARAAIHRSDEDLMDEFTII